VLYLLITPDDYHPVKTAIQYEMPIQEIYDGTLRCTLCIILLLTFTGMSLVKNIFSTIAEPTHKDS
jgi:hypothetical protein